jgi:hypothetical protein
MPYSRRGWGDSKADRYVFLNGLIYWIHMSMTGISATAPKTV